MTFKICVSPSNVKTYTERKEWYVQGNTKRVDERQTGRNKGRERDTKRGKSDHCVHYSVHRQSF